METKLGRSATIFGDWTRMHQIVMNLCLNARDAIADAPGHVTVDLGDAYPSLDWPKAPDNQGDGSDAEQRVIFKQAGNRSFMWMGMQPRLAT